MKRNTAQRKAIETVFEKYDRPLGIGEILNYGSKLIDSLNQATIYRNLKLLVENGWLTRFNHPSMGTLYERTGKDHHHHFHCRTCKRTLELPGCALKKGEIVPDGYVVEDHEVLFFGICPSCTKGKNGFLIKNDK